MEVKSVYMDLQEGVKKGNVWKLESEAFKKPIEIKIGYDNKELAEFKGMVNDLKAELDKKDKEILDLKRMDADIDHGLKLTQNELLRQKDTNIFLGEEIQKNKSEINQLYKVIADLKTTVETLSGTIIHLQDEMKLIQKKITKQPMVFSDTTFISGHERVGLGVLEVPSGEYLLIEKYLVCEANEFVTNNDGIIFNKVTVTNNQYIPMYMLMGGTPLDTPTAKIYRDLVFIPM